MTLRILFIVHRHVTQSFGGAEGAAFNLFESMKKVGCETAFIGAAGHEKQTPPLEEVSKNNFRLWGSASDTGMLDMSPSPATLRAFSEFLETFQPDIIHFHHIIRLGLESIQIAKHYQSIANKPVALIYTLHEYMAICPSDGQMLRIPNDDLCLSHEESDCLRCIQFHNLTYRQLVLRRQRFECLTELIDGFISPSAFLKDQVMRYIRIPEIDVIENITMNLPDSTQIEAASPPGDSFHLGFFGRLSRRKGADLALNAFHLLPPEIQGRVHLHFYGDDDDRPEFSSAFSRAANRHKNVHTHGRYDAERVIGLMSQMHAVLVPSIWFENSPMVIQEAFYANRPVICSDIGGMAEKVSHGVNGLHFEARSAADLARKIQMMMSPELWQQLQNAARPKHLLHELCTEHLRVYHKALRTSNLNKTS